VDEDDWSSARRVGALDLLGLVLGDVALGSDRAHWRTSNAVIPTQSTAA
jgi:hypothetical protein